MASQRLEEVRPSVRREGRRFAARRQQSDSPAAARSRSTSGRWSRLVRRCGAWKCCDRDCYLQRHYLARAVASAHLYGGGARGFRQGGRGCRRPWHEAELVRPNATSGVPRHPVGTIRNEKPQPTFTKRLTDPQAAALNEPVPTSRLYLVVTAPPGCQRISGRGPAFSACGLDRKMAPEVVPKS